jgi:hypothetical protein
MSAIVISYLSQNSEGTIIYAIFMQVAGKDDIDKDDGVTISEKGSIHLY